MPSISCNRKRFHRQDRCFSFECQQILNMFFLDKFKHAFENISWKTHHSEREPNFTTCCLSHFTIAFFLNTRRIKRRILKNHQRYEESGRWKKCSERYVYAPWIKDFFLMVLSDIWKLYENTLIHVLVTCKLT